MKFFGDSAEKDEVGHPAEEENHRSRLEVRLSAAGVGISVVPGQERDAERQKRNYVEAGQQHPHKPRFGASSCQLGQVGLPGGAVVTVKQVDAGVPQRQDQAVNDASGEENRWPDQP